MGRGINYSVGRNRESKEKEKVRLRKFSEQINLLLRKHFNLWFLDTIDVALQILLSNYCLAVQGINAPLVFLVIRVAAAFCLFIHTHNYIYIYLHNCSLICFCGGWSSYPSKNDLTKKYLDTTCSRDLLKNILLSSVDHLLLLLSHMHFSPRHSMSQNPRKKWYRWSSGKKRIQT